MSEWLLALCVLGAAGLMAAAALWENVWVRRRRRRERACRSLARRHADAEIARNGTPDHEDARPPA